MAVVTVDAYTEAFERERAKVYPVIDEFERSTGYALERDRYEAAAQILACPVKVNPPHWQHGRVLYAVARRYLSTCDESVTMLDIGTAKGYSALCLQWALMDSGVQGQVHSVDAIDPEVRAQRNTVAEVDGLKTLAETLAPWPEASLIRFTKNTGLEWLAQHKDRVHIAFVDGKHSGPVVKAEGELLAVRQTAGDVAIFDDVHIPGVDEAVTRLNAKYDVQRIMVLPNRAYAIGYRR